MFSLTRAKEEWTDWALAALIFGIAAAVLLFRLDHPVLWADEIFTSNYIRQEFSYLFSLERPDERHPPGYYALLKLWAAVFGETRTSIRGFSVAVALACLPLLYAIIRLRFSPRIALMAMLFLALFPGFVHYGREARMYALLFFFMLLASYFLLKLYTHFEHFCVKQRLSVTLGFSVALAGTFYTHYIAIAYIAAFGVAILALGAHSRATVWFCYATAGFIGAILLSLPQVIHMLGFIDPDQTDWIKPTTPRLVYDMVSGSFDAPRWAKPLLYGVFAYGAVLLWRADRALFVFVASILGFGIALLAVIGVVKPVLLIRTIQPLTLMAPLFVALVIARASRLSWLLGILAATFVIATNAVTIADRYPPAREALVIETALPLLDTVEPARDRVFYLAHLDWQLEYFRLKSEAFIPIGFTQFETGRSKIEAHLRQCASRPDCGRTIILLERNPKYQTASGARWIAFAKGAGPSRTTPLDTHVAYVFE